jgi:translocation and assembly module TamB
MRRLGRIIAGLAALLLMAWAGFQVLVRSHWIREEIRQRAIQEIRKSTGARAELESVDFGWPLNQVRVTGLVLHGKEGPEHAPLLRVDRAQADLRVLAWIRPGIDLVRLQASGIRVNLLTYPDGTTNLPAPAREGRNPLEQILKLAIDQIELRDAELTWNFQRYPFALRARDLMASLAFAGQPDRYRGTVSARQAALEGFNLRDVNLDIDADLELGANSAVFERLRARLGDSIITATGALHGWKEIRWEAKAQIQTAVRELASRLSLKLPVDGPLTGEGLITYSAREGIRVQAEAQGIGWSYQDSLMRLQRIQWSAAAQYRDGQLNLSRFRADSPDGSFRGSASTDFKRYQARGTLSGLRVERALELAKLEPSWRGLITGPLRVAGDRGGFEAAAHLSLISDDSEHAISGSVNGSYSSRTGLVNLEPSEIQSKSTSVRAAGNLAEGVTVSAAVADLGEIPFAAPVALKPGGSVRFEGVIRGRKSQTFDGLFRAVNLEYEGQTVDSVEARVNASAEIVNANGLELRQGGLRVTGNGSIELEHWRLANGKGVDATLTVQGADLVRLAKQVGSTADLGGVASGSVRVSGRWPEPSIQGPVRVEGARWEKESLGVITAQIRTGPDRIELNQGSLQLGGAPVLVSGWYVHEPGQWQSGDYRIEARWQDLALERVLMFREKAPEVSGPSTADIRAAGRIEKKDVRVTGLTGSIAMPRLLYQGKSLGSLNLRAAPEQAGVRITATGNLRAASLNATSRWNLGGRLEGSGEFQIRNIRLSDFEELALKPGQQLQLDSTFSATGTFRGPLLDPTKILGTARVDQLAIVSRQLAGDVQRDLTVRSAAPLEFGIDERGVTLKPARLQSRETNLEASGLVSLDPKKPSNLRLSGKLGLGLVSALKPDLVASGESVIDAAFRGTLAEPILSGRMEFRDASFFLRNVSNGLENVRGVIFFDRQRARIESFTAQSGGGTLRLGGFIGFGEELSYQLQAQGQNVRIRYPEGVSTTVNSALTLSGGSARGLVTGSVTILRMGVNPRADIATMLAETQRSAAAAPRIENEFLKDLQFDVKIDTALDAQLTTSLTQNVQAEVNLRLRGSPARPVLLGRVAVTQGEVNFFGAKYTIDRGEIGFYNPTKSEPVLNVDLQTRIRGVLVTITFAGPANKLNLSYRSDPPLQSQDILALLTVGRAPDGSIVGGGSNVQSPTFLQGGGTSTALLGQAAAAPLTGRLQRLFGVSRLRIDPQLTGIENTAQARLTIEQQVSRDITVTFITNLNRTQQQVVSVQWDFSREFSAVAIRDENGVFGIDFFYRKRIK